jgi:hypothetical protein
MVINNARAKEHGNLQIPNYTTQASKSLPKILPVRCQLIKFPGSHMGAWASSISLVILSQHQINGLDLLDLYKNILLIAHPFITTSALFYSFY